jgi:hypothetical protein
MVKNTWWLNYLSETNSSDQYSDIIVSSGIAKIHRLKKYMAIWVVGRDIFFNNFRKRPGYYCYLMKTLLIGHFLDTP